MDELVNIFRLASRELFNNYFLKPFLENEDWELLEHFTLIEDNLFLALVTTRAGITAVNYGEEQPDIVVSMQSAGGLWMPIMLNREIDSGYWDHAVERSAPGCVFKFRCFFDWDQHCYKDNRYVRVVVAAWPGSPELVGKHALIETQYVSYSRAQPLHVDA